MSKGSGRRKKQVSDEKFKSSWDSIFNKSVEKDIKATFGKEEVEVVTYGTSDYKRIDKLDD